jgi:hypothetical protein
MDNPAAEEFTSTFVTVWMKFIASLLTANWIRHEPPRTPPGLHQKRTRAFALVLYPITLELYYGPATQSKAVPVLAQPVD